MPTRSYAQQIGDIGQALVESWFEHPRWVARKQSHDFGIDLEAELAVPIDHKQRMTGKLIKLQIKSSAKIERGAVHIAYPVPRELIHYADAFRLPVILAVACIETKTVWWLLVRATALLDLYPRGGEKLVDVLIGGQYGSEGKGNIVGHIATEYDLLVRVGGPNAGHQVFAEPKPEKYYHLPSGTKRAPNARLLLGPGAVINPKKLLDELADHSIDRDRLIIDGQAMIISDEDIEEEQRLFGNISSTAQGVGVASARKLTGRSDYKSGEKLFLAKDCDDLKPFIGSARKILADAFVNGHRILLEGTQGTSLSVHHGQYPHVTTRDTTVAGCLADAGIAPSNVRRVAASVSW